MDNNYIKDPKFVLCFIFLEFFSIFLFLVPIHSIDWRIQWTAATYIVQGVPLYEQAIYSIRSEKLILPPHHFPVFFYILAIVAITGSELVGKLFMWFLFNVMVALFFKILKPENIRDALFLLFVLFIHPAVIGLSVFKTFDSIMVIFMLLTYDSFRSQNYKFTGIYLGIASILKFIPIMLLIPIFLILSEKRKFKELLSVLTTFSLVFFTQLIFFIYYFNNFIEETFFWQYERGERTLTLWGHFYPEFFESSNFALFQLLVLGTTLLSLSSVKKNQWNNPFWSVYTIIILMFIFIYRTHYGHYGFWFFVGLVFVYYSLFQQKRYKILITLFLSNMLYYTGVLICLNTCNTRNKLNLIQHFAVVLINFDLFLLSFLVIFIENYRPRLLWEEQEETDSILYSELYVS